VPLSFRLCHLSPKYLQVIINNDLIKNIFFKKETSIQVN